MFEGFYFEYPKFASFLFVYLACANLCPLRLPSLYVPHISRFWSAEVHSPAWMWISKWVMIAGLIVAIMSPVVEIKEPLKHEGYSTLLVVDNHTPETLLQVERLCALRPFDTIALIMPPNLKIPLTRDHQALVSMFRQMPSSKQSVNIDYGIKSILSNEKRPWIIVFAARPKEFVRSLPTQIDVDIVPTQGWEKWMKQRSDHHPIIPIVNERKIVEYLYMYPLFLAFMAMVVYLYGRNQKGLL